MFLVVEGRTNSVDEANGVSMSHVSRMDESYNVYMSHVSSGGGAHKWCR